jgi:hypothetical protein
MGKLFDRKESKGTTIVHLNQKTEFDERYSIGIDKDYRKILEEKIKEKKLILETTEIKGTSRENIQKKLKWMTELINALLKIKDILERTELIKVNIIYRARKIIINDLKNVTIKSIDYDENKIVKNGFKLDIDFFPRSQALNNKRDCYLVQLLGKTSVDENVMKYYSLDSLMEFIINYCSEYIAEISRD